MAEITLNVPDNLAEAVRRANAGSLKPSTRGASAKVTLGRTYRDAREVLEFLAGLPTPEEVMQLKSSPRLRSRVSELLQKNRSSGLSTEESAELDQYEYLDHLVRIAKAKALLKTNEA